MNRRDFVRLTSTGLTAGALAEGTVAAQVASRPAGAAPSRARMKAGTQHGDSDPILRVLAGFGVNHICSRLPSAQMGPEWSVDALNETPRARRIVRAHARHGAAAPELLGNQPQREPGDHARQGARPSEPDR